jgi:molybdate/tungstate transport system substrate-binding protein
MREGIAAVLAAVALMGCDRNSGKGGNTAAGKDTVLIFVAASLTNAVRPQLDSFTAAAGTVVLTESGGSMEHVRKLTELHRIPDLMLMADDEVFEKYLSPNYVTWWADFAHNRMGLAYTDKSKAANEIGSDNWYKVVTRAGVEVGRADPKAAPVGYRTLTLFTLAALRYGDPDLARRLAAAAPEKNVRPNAAELAALLEAGQLDYIYDYESVARSHGFRFLVMPPELTGRPVTYALSIPVQAPHRRAAEALAGFLETPATIARLRAAFVDMMDRPDVHGTGAPAAFTKP